MPYATTNPPALQTQAIAGPRHWIYQSADSQADVNTAGYFTNGWELGMRANDTVTVIDTDTGQQSIHTVLTATEAAGVDLNDGTAITNTDTD
jgi:hypothetical protein